MMITPKSQRPLAAAVVAAAVAVAAPASAQVIEAGVSVPPLVMIQLDTSGSMEWVDDAGANNFPLCVVDGTVGPGGLRSRLHAAIEVLTGNVVDRYCAEDLRDTSPTRIDQVDPTRPQGIRHSRLCSMLGLSANHASDCVPVDPAAPFAGLPQDTNGLIDEFGDEIAFGFMAFDSFPEEGGCALEMYSYGPARSMSGSGVSPSPPSTPEAVPSCSLLGGDCWNLGARSPYVDESGAPNCVDGSVPQGWTIPPVDPSGALTQGVINDQVQDQILRLVPYWSTPLGAMLEDAYTFYVEPPQYFSYRSDPDAHDATYGYTDPYGECRKRYVLLITDGIPSFDACVRVGTNGPDTRDWDAGCENYPYADAAYYAAKLADAGIPVYVVGFSLDADPDATTILNEIAAAGGTEEARFANSGLALIFELGDVFSQIASGTPSRTTPANTTRLSASDAVQGQFTFEANFEIHEGSPYWTGDITRIDRVCSGGNLGDPVENSIAEVYDDIDVADLDDFPILTTSPRWHSCYFRGSGVPDTSLFPPQGIVNPLLAPYGVTALEIAAACQVDAPPGDTALASVACSDLADGGVGFSDTIPGGTWEPYCLTELDATTAAAYPWLFGAETARESEMFANWLRGWNLTELRLLGGYQGEVDQVLPSAETRWDPVFQRYTNDRRSRLAPIVHSSPTVVTVPDSRLEISEGYSAFVEATRNRPSVLYTATTDGLLRAIDAETSAELFAFLPSSVAHRIGNTMEAQRQIIDGPPVIEDIRTHRDAAGNERWATVLLLPYRGAARGVVALDVTDPTTPRFLWELDGELDPQLGLTYSGPAMGTVFLAECLTSGAPACERGVAIIGGGAPPDGLTGWETSNIGRTLYVVDIETGQVLRRFTHYRDELGVSVPIPAPVVGDVAVFDSFAGSLVTRAFVGTANGQLLRLDLAKTDPADWVIDLMFDPAENPIDEDDLGGIFFKPTIALSRVSGRAVIVFGTGNLDDLDRVIDEQNFVISITEAPIYDADGNLVRYGSDLNWALELATNERMTARPRIFDRRAYFATFVPEQNLCEIGGARLYALDFIGLPENAGRVGQIDTDHFSSYLREDPYDTTDPNPIVGFHDASTYDGLSPVVIPPKAIIYSLNITERVSCFEDTDLAGARYDGQSVSRQVSDQGEFVLQIGVSSYADSGDGSGPEAVSQLAEVGLDEPAAAIIPTSWSVIFE